MSPTNSSGYAWQTVPWRKHERTVYKLQTRIFRAARRGETKTVHRLQRLLIRSWAARCLAVRKVTQDNRGKRTAGVDGVKSLPPPQRLALATHLTIRPSGQPLRRIWIPKPGRAEPRPLGIPTLGDRASQTLARLALEPEWEARFEPHSYGFRPGRSAHDAIEAIFTGICKKPKYVLEADIEACFDRVDHAALLAKLGTFPTVRRAIRGWLKAGVLDGAELFPTDAGAAQGGPLSPLLANVALHGLETAIRTAFPKDLYGHGPVRWGWRPLVVRYADDFVILHEDRAVLEQARQLAATWLAELGLKLKPSKTRISHTLEPVEGQVGFDFLGFEVRQYPIGSHRAGALHLGFKTWIKPSKSSQRRQYAALAALVRQQRQAPQRQVISALNPRIRGWARYYATVVSKATFSTLDHRLFGRLLRWGRRRHPKKGAHWVVQRYWHTRDRNHWVFGEPTGPRLASHASTPIRRHVLVRGQASPYDGNWRYRASRLGRHPELPTSKARLLQAQRGKCAWCGQYFTALGDLLEIDHRHPRSRGGSETTANRQLLHAHCHDVKTARDGSTAPRQGGIDDNRPTTEEPCERETLTHGSEGERGAARSLA